MKNFLIIASIFITQFAKGQQSEVNEALLLHRAQQSLTDVIVHDIFSPPAASRIYLYSNLAAYEVLTSANRGLRSFGKIFKNFPSVPDISKPNNVHVPLAAVSAFINTSRNLIFSEERLLDSAEQIYTEFRKSVKDPKKFQASIDFGKKVADSILAYASKDQYRETRSMRRFTLNAAAGRWIPTPPAYMAAVEPHWGKMRPAILDSASQFKPPMPAAYGMDSAGKFYQQALEVYNTVRKLNSEQRDIALFWDCNPFFVNTSGHLMFATKKLSPGGHWISIARIAAEKQGADIYLSSQAYTYTAIALYDGFISCWDEKYRSNYIRPESFINSHVDESWRPLLQTPPFPEYTSGHSVISSAAATVLSSIFGEQFHFDDWSEVGYGLPVRTFTSFEHAANEAAISRLYGGIHFREAIEHGQEQGKKIGQFIVAKLLPGLAIK